MNMRGIKLYIVVLIFLFSCKNIIKNNNTQIDNYTKTISLLYYNPQDSLCSIKGIWRAIDDTVGNASFEINEKSFYYADEVDAVYKYRLYSKDSLEIFYDGWVYQGRFTIIHCDTLILNKESDSQIFTRLKE